MKKEKIVFLKFLVILFIVGNAKLFGQFRIDRVSEGAVTFYARGTTSPINIFSCESFPGSGSYTLAGQLHMIINGTPYLISSVILPLYGDGFLANYSFPAGVRMTGGTTYSLRYTPPSSCSDQTIYNTPTYTVPNEYVINYGSTAPCLSAITFTPNHYNYLDFYVNGGLNTDAVEIKINGVGINDGVLANEYNRATNLVSSINNGTVTSGPSPGTYSLSTYNSLINSATTTTYSSKSLTDPENIYHHLRVGPILVISNDNGGSTAQYEISNNFTGLFESAVPGYTPTIGDEISIVSTASHYSVLINSTSVYSYPKTFTLTSSLGTMSPSVAIPGQSVVWSLPTNTTSAAIVDTIKSVSGTITYVDTYTIYPTPVITTPSYINTSICSGFPLNINIAAAIPSTYTWSASNNVNTTGESTTNQTTSIINDNVINNSISNQLVVYTVTPQSTLPGGCLGTVKIVSVTVNPVPLINSISSPTICSGGSLNIPISSSVNATYSWLATNNLNITGESTSAVVSSTINNTLINTSSLPQLVTYTITPTAVIGGCDGNSYAVAVTVNPLPTITAIPSSAAICSGATATLTAGGASTYTWTAGPISATYPVSTAGVFTVTGTNSNGCVNTRTVNLTVNALPVVTAVPNATAICAGATATLTAGGATTYTWTAGPTSATYPVSTAGIYTVTGTDINNCVNTRTVSLTVNPLPTITAVPSSTAICAGATATLTAGGATTYTWTAGPTSATYPVSTTGIYTVTGTNSNGCINTRTVGLTVNPLPTIIAVPSSAAICTGATATLTAGGASTYTWTSGPTSATYPVSTAGVYTVSGTNSNGCVNTRTVSLIVNPNPSLTTTAGGLLNVSCLGSATGSLSTTASGTSGYSYVWSPSVSSTNSATGLNAGVYTTTVTDVNGCKAVLSNTLSAPSSSLATAVATSTTGCGLANGTATVTPSGGWSSGYNYLWQSSASTSSTVSGYSAGTYTVSVTDANGCKSINTFIITNPNTPTITITSSNLAICSGATATLTAGGASTYTWTAGPTSATYPVSTAGVYTVTGTDAFNCINTKTVSLTVNPLPTITVVPSTTAICSGATATLTAGGATTYTWTSGPVSATYPVNTAGVYTVTGTNSNGCVNTRTVSLTVNPLPTITAASSSAAICSGSTATLTAGGASTYTWTSGPVSATYPVNTAGVYTVTGTNSNGCVNTRTVGLTVNPNPSLTTTAGGLLNVSCLGSATGSLSTTASGTSGYSYVWSPSVSTSNVATGLNAGVYTTTVTDVNGCKAVLSNTISAPSASLATAVATRTTGCGIANGSATVTPSGGWSSSYTYTWSSGSSTSNTATGLLAGAYTATVTDANGCKAIQVVNIVNPTTPTLTVSASSSAICSGNSSVITPSLSTSVLSYSVNGVASAGPSFTVNPIATSIYNINATDVSNCVSNLASLTITVNATPTLAIALSSTSICVGTSATLTPSGASTYTLVNTGAAITTNTVVNPTATTVYTVSGTSVAGCLGAQQTINLAVNALPNLTLSTSSNTICAGNNATLTANGADTYSWTSGPSDANYIVNPTTTTVYEVIGTNTVTTCNSAISQITITVNSVPTVTANASPSTVCSNGSINLTALGATTYTWSGTGITSTNENSVNPIFAAPTASTYIYNLVGSNSDGCLSSISTVTVDVVGAPSSSLAIANQIICIGTTGVFEIANPQSGVAYTWNSVSTGTNYSVGSPITNTAGNYTINVVAMLGAGSNTCATTSNGTLTINELPTVTIDQTNLTLCDGEQATISIVNPLPAPATYAWSYNNSTGNSLTLSNLEAGSSGNYTVTVNDGNGCSNQTTFELVVNACGVFIPELFSPNGDYQNDVFVIKNIENYPNNHVLIYNRWGNLVYEKNGYNNDWKGTNDKADNVRLFPVELL